jgi:hypothetical protein
MKIFFTCSQTGREYAQNFQQIMQAIVKNKNQPELLATEDLSYLKVAENLKAKGTNPKYLHAESVRRAIFESDGIVIDNTVSSFRLGHEATLAMLKNKPVLVLSQNVNYEDLMNFKNFHAAKYDPKDSRKLQFIIDDFLEKVRVESLSIRFNLFISESDKEYLGKTSKEESLTMSEYLRKLVKEDKERKLKISL